MKITYQFILALIFLPTVAFAQAQEKTPLRNLLKPEIGFHGAGIAYDMKLNEKATVDLAAGLGGGYRVTGSSYKYSWDFLSPVVYIRAHFKRYYNREKRFSNGKTIRNNSGNFVGAVIKYTSGDLGQPRLGDILFGGSLNEALNLNIHWGMQRALGERFLFNQMIGIAYSKDLLTESAAILPAYNLKFSYILNKAE